MALSVRLRSSLPRHHSSRFAGWWLLPLLLAGSCLNPQPDPFPQADDSSDARQGGPEVAGASSTETGPVSSAPLAPPAPEPGSSPPATPAANPTDSAVEAPPAEDEADAGAPPDAGADAGTSGDPLVSGD